MPSDVALSPLSDIAAEIAQEVAGKDPPPGSGVSVTDVAAQVHKGQPVTLFDRRSFNSASDTAVDCRNYNAIRVGVIAWGSSPSVVLTFYGRDEAGGYPLQVAGPTGQQTVTSSQEIIVPVGAAFVSAELSSISGSGAMFTVTATPFILSAPATVALASGTASVGVVDTELPAAAALADGAANPTTPTAGAAALLFNGTTWDRARGDTANGLDVDVTRIQTADHSGTIYIGSTAYTVKRAFANIAASQTDAAIVAAVASKSIRVLALAAIAGGTATTITFNSKPGGAGTAISPAFANAANGGEILPLNLHGWFQTTAGEGLTATTGAGSTTGVLVTYIEV